MARTVLEHAYDRGEYDRELQEHKRRAAESYLRARAGLSNVRSFDAGGNPIMPPNARPEQIDYYNSLRARIDGNANPQFDPSQMESSVGNPLGPGHTRGFAAAQGQSPAQPQDRFESTAPTPGQIAAAKRALPVLQSQLEGDTSEERRASAQELGTEASIEQINQIANFEPEGFTPNEIGITPPSMDSNGNEARPLTPEQRGFTQSPDGSYQRGSAIGGVPGGDVQTRMDEMGNAPQAYHNRSFDPGQGEMPRRQPEGFARTAQSDGRGGINVRDERVSKRPSFEMTYEAPDGRFVAETRGGRRQTFDTQEEATRFSSGQMGGESRPSPISQPEQPSGSVSSNESSTPTPSRPESPKTTPNPKGSGLDASFYNPQIPHPAPSNPKGSGLSSSFYNPTESETAQPEPEPRKPFVQSKADFEPAGWLPEDSGGQDIVRFVRGIGDRRQQAFDAQEERRNDPSASGRSGPQNMQLGRALSWLPGQGESRNKVTPPSEIRTTEAPSLENTESDVERERRRRRQNRIQMPQGAGMVAR